MARVHDDFSTISAALLLPPPSPPHRYLWLDRLPPAGTIAVDGLPSEEAAGQPAPARAARRAVGSGRPGLPRRLWAVHVRFGIVHSGVVV